MSPTAQSMMLVLHMIERTTVKDCGRRQPGTAWDPGTLGGAGVETQYLQISGNSSYPPDGLVSIKVRKRENCQEKARCPIQAAAHVTETDRLQEGKLNALSMHLT